MAATEDPLYSTYIACSVINAFSSYTAITLNILTIHAMRKTSSLPKPLKTLLLSLAVSDLGVGLVVQPFNIATMVMKLKSTSPSLTIFQWYYFVATLFSWTSFFGVVAISLDRLLAIELHLRYQELVTQKRVTAVVISIWVFSAILSLIISFQLVPVDDKSLNVIVVVVIGLCFISTTIIYCKIYITVRRHTKQINVLRVPQHELELANNARQRKSAVGTFFIFLVFLVCSLPEYCRLLLTFFLHNPSSILMSILFSNYSWTLLFLNSSLNPLVYCWKMRNIRRAIMNIIRGVFFKPQGSNPTINSDVEPFSNSVRMTVYTRRDTHF